ncbi:MAG: hypothetical protein AB1942_03415 [Pseudomonadota bacterium]
MQPDEPEERDASAGAADEKTSPNELNGPSPRPGAIDGAPSDDRSTDADRRGPESINAQFSGGASTRLSLAYAPLGTWRASDGDAGAEAPIVPRRVGVRLVECADLRPIAECLRREAAPEDVVLDLEHNEAEGRFDDRRLDIILESYRSALTPGCCVVVHPGERGRGSEFWEHDLDLPRLDAFCADGGHPLVIVSLAPAATPPPGLGAAQVQKISAWPLVAWLASACDDLDGDVLADAQALVEAGRIDICEVIRDLDSRAADDLAQRVASARSAQPGVQAAEAFVERFMFDGDPASAAIAFTMACFGELTPSELREVAQDLAMTPDLLEPPAPTAVGEPAPAPRTRIDDRVQRSVGVVFRDRRRQDGSRQVMAVLRGPPLGAVRAAMAEVAPIATARLVDQMSVRLVHGAVSPERWVAACDTVGRALLREGDASPAAIAHRIAVYWTGDRAHGDAPPPERAALLSAEGAEKLDQLCAAVAALRGMDRSQLLVLTASALAARSGAVSLEAAWRAPAAAAFAAHVLGQVDAPDLAQSLVEALHQGPGEVLTLVSAGLTGAFGLPAALDEASPRLDMVLQTSLRLALAPEAPAALKPFAAAMAWRLLALRLGRDAVRLSSGGPPAISPELSQALLDAARELTSPEASDLYEQGAASAWIESAAFDHLQSGWREAPEVYLDDSFGGPGSVIAGEATFLASMRTLDALTANAELLAQRQTALETFVQRFGVAGDVSVVAATLWCEPGDGANPQPSRGERAFRGCMYRLRAAIPVLAAAFAHAEISDAEAQQVRIRMPAPGGDHEAWSALATAVHDARDATDSVLEIWRDVVADLPRDDLVLRHLQTIAQRSQLIYAWWSELQAQWVMR